ncbi:MAG: hypothetical protein M1816_001592 [Peltula sp. TS41687]|nr:MAG: hypothetical protein M1816_001592 [Peltula sp. TS41687]
MPSIQYFDQSAPFWDFVASFEDQAFNNKESAPADEKEENQPTGDKDTNNPHPACGGGAGRPPRHGGPHHGGGWSRGGFCGGRRGRGFHHPPPHHHGGPWNMNPFLQFLQSQFNIPQDDASDSDSNSSKDYQPPVDVFETPSAYHIHVSLPGAKKEDVGLNYNADKSELSIAGVIYRPGDEEFLKNLAMAERKVGAFERKVKLGNERHPAEIDTDGITAKLEDGVLRIELPRLEKDFVSVKKVDIE